MDSWGDLIGAGVTALAALGLAFHRFRGRPVVSRRLLQVLGASQEDAELRGHRPLTVTHVALALLADPHVASELERRGVSLQSLYDEVEHLLPPRAASAVKLAPSDCEPAVAALFRNASHGISTAGPMGVLDALLRSDHEALRSVFERHGLTALRSPSPSSAQRLSNASPAVPSVESNPYRTADIRANTDVVFWNDSKTRQAFVTQILRGTFGIGEPHATRLALTIDHEGFAIVGTYDRPEAERLREATLRLAREQGFPLEVSIAEAGRTSSMSTLGRWLLRRRARAT
ncbi:MAG: ATP-dependent Clp protease adaptor ClpS [Labilithrix sp.]|nr:ATP-dependent Clp protease adaptor ClpS [Labilithrix sp.]